MKPIQYFLFDVLRWPLLTVFGNFQRVILSGDSGPPCLIQIRYNPWQIVNVLKALTNSNAFGVTRPEYDEVL